jgi:DNA-binding HxlR family transcriptional regulator
VRRFLLESVSGGFISQSHHKLILILRQPKTALTAVSESYSSFLNQDAHQQAQYLIPATCPLGGTGVGGCWKFWIWYHLLSGPKRFGELQRFFPQASQQALTLQLRALERMGIVRRKVYVQSPPKVEYALTELGWSLGPVMRQSYAWVRWYYEQVGLEFDWPVSDEAEVYTYR